MVISRILPWDPRLPVAIPGELEGIPEEVSGWNGSELNSERIHVRFSRNRRWNSGGWHRPGKAESGGFWWTLAAVALWPPLAAGGARAEPAEGRGRRPLGPFSPPAAGSECQLPCPWAARGLGGRFQMWRGAGEGPSAIGTVLGKDPEFAAVRASSGGGR